MNEKTLSEYPLLNISIHSPSACVTLKSILAYWISSPHEICYSIDTYKFLNYVQVCCTCHHKWFFAWNSTFGVSLNLVGKVFTRLSMCTRNRSILHMHQQRQYASSSIYCYAKWLNFIHRKGKYWQLAIYAIETRRRSWLNRKLTE